MRPISKEGRQRLDSILLLFFLFLFVAGFPFSLFIKDPAWSFFAQGLFRLLYGIGLFFLAKRWGLASPRFQWSKKQLLFSPLFLLSVSNFLFLLFQRSALTPEGTLPLLLSEAFYSLMVACSEELLFRAVILGELLLSKNKGVAIILSSLIFSLAHAINFFSLAPGAVFAQIGYTFVLGLFCGLLYGEGKNLFWPILLHFLFNFIDNYLFVYFYQGEWNLPFFLVNGILGLLLLGYAVWLYFFFEKKTPETGAR
jgi:membrane protease YdiL (CAAX protease family)